jgi:hypothetical protein
MAIGASLNSITLWMSGHRLDAAGLIRGNVVIIAQVWQWSQAVDTTQHGDFKRVHRLMRWAAVLFGTYILARLASGGLFE